MNAFWELRQYPDGVLTGFLAGFEKTEPVLFARASAYLKELSEKGNKVQWPVSKPVGSKLFELRPHTDEIALRLVYYFSPTEHGVIIFVHCFVKKTESMPKIDKDLAKRRREENISNTEKKKRRGLKGGIHGRRIDN